jgi:rhodanese-related sulfurtransferase
MFARLARLFGRRPTDPVWLEPGELQERIDRGELPMIIDVRAPEEFDGPLGHIAGALNIPLAGLAPRTAELARARCPIVLVCLTDKRSSQAAAALGQAGIRDVAVLRGGMTGWRKGPGWREDPGRREDS